MSGCPYLEANGWHMYVGYWKPDGTPGYACHGCGEMPKPAVQEYDDTPTHDPA